MESKPDHELCYHKIQWVEGKNGKEVLLDKVSNENDLPSSSIEDILEKNWFIRSCSLFFRNIKLNDDFSELYVGDYPLQILLAYKGKVGFINEVMGVYRINENGIIESEWIKNKINNVRKHLENELQMWNFIQRSTNFEFRNLYNTKIAHLAFEYLINSKNLDRSKLAADYFYFIVRLFVLQSISDFIKINYLLNKLILNSLVKKLVLKFNKHYELDKNEPC